MFTPTPLDTRIPSITPSLTATFTPTPTSSPTNTPTPTIPAPSQLSKFFEGVQFTYFEGFDKIPLTQWNKQPCQAIDNGELVYACASGYFGRKNDFALQDGEGILIDFNHPSQTDSYYWSIALSTGFAGKPGWKTFGISEDEIFRQAISLYDYKTNLGTIQNWIKPDVWYRLALAMDSNGTIAILLWERDKPDAYVFNYLKAMGAGWSGQQWLFWVNNNQSVTLDLDNYYEFSFDKINR
jgi:hypothetical protein